MPDGAAFERFYRENVTRVARACALITMDTNLAEDMAAEAFTQLWSHWGQISGDDHAGGYVFKTATRLCWREVRRRGRREEGPPPPEEIHQVGLDPDLKAALQTLSLRQREAVVLRDWAGFELAEVATMMRVAPPTARVHLHRGRAALRTLLGSREDADV